MIMGFWGYDRKKLMNSDWNVVGMDNGRSGKNTRAKDENMFEL